MNVNVNVMWQLADQHFKQGRDSHQQSEMPTMIRNRQQETSYKTNEFNVNIYETQETEMVKRALKLASAATNGYH